MRYTADEDQTDPWPRCPGCGSQRLSVCPACGDAGADFELADTLDEKPGPEVPVEPAHEDESASEGWLVCPTCEEIFLPRYYRCCHACGHDFRTGLEIEVDEQLGQFNLRVASVAIVVLAIPLALALFYWLLLR